MRRVPRSTCCVVLLVLLLLPLPAMAGVFEATGSHRFYDQPDGTSLVKPSSLYLGPTGELVVWDEATGRFRAINRGDTPSHRDDHRDLWENLLYQQALHAWGVDEPPRAFWDATGRFWAYRSGYPSDSSTRLVNLTSDTFQTLTLESSIRSVVASGEHWIVQPASPREPLMRWDPATPEGLVDTAAVSLRGRLVGITAGGLYVTRQGNRVRVYRRGRERSSRRFSGLLDLEVQGRSIYLLQSGPRVVRLNQSLSVQFTHYLDGTTSFRRFALSGQRIYLLSRKGLYEGVLDESGRSFFNQSVRLHPRKIRSTLPNLLERAGGDRLWVGDRDNGTRVLVRRSRGTVQPLDFVDNHFRTAGSPRDPQEFSRGVFQYFQVDSTYWNGSDRLYYFYSDKNLLEVYDRQGRLLRRTRIPLNSLEGVRQIRFLGADRDRILFQARVRGSGGAYRRSVLVFDWDGNRRRTFHLHHPQGNERFPLGDRRPIWKYGQEYLYELHADHVQRYDLQGYPAGVIEDVYWPRDLVVGSGRVFVLDLNGWRLRSFRIPEPDHYRYATPPGKIEVTSAWPGPHDRTILSARPRSGSDKNSLYEYNHSSRESQLVLEHPTQTLRFPSISPGGDTLYFWGRKAGAKGDWTLYQSDRVKYSAQRRNHQLPVRGPGFFSPRRGKLFVPVHPASDTAAQYAYLNPGDTQQHLLGSRNLELLEPGGFTGFYGVVKSDTGESLVSGYLTRSAETAPLRWRVSDTLYRTSGSIEQIDSRGGDIHVSVTTPSGLSRLGILDEDQLSEGVAPNPSPRWLHGARGTLRWVREEARGYRILHRTGRVRGRLVDLYEGPEAPTGGLQGEVTANEPRTLEDIPLRIEPGGIQFRTRKGGRFSVSGVPVGYVELQSDSYNHHFPYPIRVVVNPDQYTLRSSIPLDRREELLLLEKGISFLEARQFRRARISLEAFRELVQKGPYHRWTDGLLEEIYRARGDTSSLYRLYRRRPDLFSSEERLDLFGSVGRKGKRRILESFTGSVEFKETQLIGYLLTRLGGDSVPDGREFLSPPRQIYPLLQELDPVPLAPGTTQDTTVPFLPEDTEPLPAP